MRRVVIETGPPPSPPPRSGFWRSTVRNWNAFFFTPADPLPLGLVRVLVGVLAFWSLLVYGLDFADFFGPGGWADVETVRAVQGDRLPYAWSLWFYVPVTLLRPCWVICLIVLAMFAAGLYSRATAVLAWAIIVSTVRRSPVTLYGFDQQVSTWALYLAVCGASGQSVSVDRWRRSRGSRGKMRALAREVPEATVSANLGLRLIQLHLCLVYGAAGLAKLQGQAWWNGTAIWGALAAGEFRLFDLTWMAAFPLLINAMTHAGLAMELGYPVLIWVRPLRPLFLAAAVALHVGVGLTLGLGEFAAAMIAGNLAFVSGPWLRGMLRKERDPAAKPDRTVVHGV